MMARRLACRRLVRLVVLTVLLLTVAAAAPTAVAEPDVGSDRWIKERTAALPEAYQQWLRNVDFILSDEERQLFLELAEDYQRDAFIERFWKARDPYPDTGRNEYREDYLARLGEARQTFGGGPYDDRTKVLLTNGFPLQRVQIDCRQYLSPTEVWYYDGSERYRGEFYLLFFQRWRQGPWRLWEPWDGVNALSSDQDTITQAGIRRECGWDGEAILTALNFLRKQGGTLGGGAFIGRLTQSPEPPEREWLASFNVTSTELPEEAATFDAELSIDFVGRRQNRTVIQGAVQVPLASIETTQLEGADLASYNLLMNGEILRDGRLFDDFRYQFDVEATEAGDPLPLVFERFLRPGAYDLRLRVKDLASGAFYRVTRVLDVPRIEVDGPPRPVDPKTAKLLAEANAALRAGETTIRIPPLRGTWQTGLVRIDAVTTGDDIASVTFFLDGTAVLTKRRPPWNVELDLGDVPRSRVLRLEAYDAEGVELAADERMLNAGDHRFAVRLEEPRRGKTYRDSLRASIDVLVPKGETIERVEVFLNEQRLATLFQPPWELPIVLPETGALAYVRAVAYTPDGRATEDLVFVNAPDNLEEVDVDFVELYTAVLDRDQRPIEGLAEAEFRVLEDGVPQQLARFEKVENLPIQVAVMLDISASMKDRLPVARDAALTFLRDTVQPKDRATVVTFNDHPDLAIDFTNDVDRLALALAGLEAERGTALWDSLIFSLYYFNGVSGQKAVLLLSDGEDESSRYAFDEALEYARRAGVALYAVGLDLPRTQLDTRRQLRKLAEATGGRAFFVDDAAELDAIYDIIRRELRSRYLLAYQSTNTTNSRAFRTIEVEVARSGAEAKTLRGYFP
ncbi:MAG: VWA domain-containing protein [Acidobacteriota bacterium]